MSTAKELFKELGYEKAEKSESVVLYTNGYGDTISFKETKHVVLIPRDGRGALFMTCLLENAIHKQCKELGWLEEEKQEIKKETNYEHYKDGIIEFCLEDLAISKGKVVECCEIPCSECDFEDKNGHCIGNHEIMKWLKQPYKKLPYKLSQFEFDLLNAYKNSGMRQCISNYGTLLEMYGKGHFKGIDTSTPIREILDNCKVV